MNQMGKWQKRIKHSHFNNTFIISQCFQSFQLLIHLSVFEVNPSHFGFFFIVLTIDIRENKYNRNETIRKEKTCLQYLSTLNFTVLKPSMSNTNRNSNNCNHIQTYTIERITFDLHWPQQKNHSVFDDLQFVSLYNRWMLYLLNIRHKIKFKKKWQKKKEKVHTRQ